MPLLALRLAATPASALAQAPAEGAATAGQAAEPAVPTRATFVSTTAEGWDVSVDGTPVCGTPCTLPLYPVQFVTLSSQERNPVLLDVGRLPEGNLMISATPHARGMYAGGVVATTFGGMALAVGITFTAVGLGKDRDAMTLAGLITGGVGAVLLPGGIYLMLKALPGFTVSSGPTYAANLGLRF